MRETGLTGKRRSTAIAATPDDGNSQRKRRRNDVRPVSRFEFERIDLAITSLLANQPVASESERASDQCKNSCHSHSRFQTD